MSKITKATLNKAIRLYPIGTKFTSLFGADDTVIEYKDPYNKKINLSHYMTSDGIFVHCKGDIYPRMIFDGKFWARINK